MAAAKKAAKKPARKKRDPKRSTSTDLVPVITPRDPDSKPPVDEEIDAQLARVARWQTTWELNRSGVSFAKIGEQTGVSAAQAQRDYKRYEEYRGASPKIEAERAYQLATFAELEVKLWREGVRGEASWAVVAREIRGLYQDRRDILGFDQAEPAAPGVAAGGGPPGVGVALRLVTGADDSAVA